MSPLGPPNARTIKLFVNLFLARFSPSDIDRATRMPIRIGLAGDRDLIERFKTFLVDGSVAADEPFPSLSLHPMPPDAKENAWRVLEDCQMVVVMLARDQLLGDTIYRVNESLPKNVAALWVASGAIEPWLRFEVSEIGRELKIGSFIWLDEFNRDSIQPLLKAFVKNCGSEMAAARKMPLLRDYVGARIIQRTSRQNLLIAMASALPATLPFIGPIVGILGVSSEIIFLTANQLRMVLQLASVYGKEMNLGLRISEILPVIGGAFGWRALSRELVGFIPGVGPGIKGSIAFAGTNATGEAARWYYKTGQQMPPEERERILNEAYAKGTALTEKVAGWLPGASKEEVKEAVEEPAEQAESHFAILRSDDEDEAAPPADSKPAAKKPRIKKPPRKEEP